MNTPEENTENTNGARRHGRREHPGTRADGSGAAAPIPVPPFRQRRPAPAGLLAARRGRPPHPRVPRPARGRRPRPPRLDDPERDRRHGRPRPAGRAARARRAPAARARRPRLGHRLARFLGPDRRGPRGLRAHRRQGRRRSVPASRARCRRRTSPPRSRPSRRSRPSWARATTVRPLRPGRARRRRRLRPRSGFGWGHGPRGFGRGFGHGFGPGYGPGYGARRGYGSRGDHGARRRHGPPRSRRHDARRRPRHDHACGHGTHGAVRHARSPARPAGTRTATGSEGTSPSPSRDHRAGLSRSARAGAASEGARECADAAAWRRRRTPPTSPSAPVWRPGDVSA